MAEDQAEKVFGSGEVYRGPKGFDVDPPPSYIHYENNNSDEAKNVGNGGGSSGGGKGSDKRNNNFVFCKVAPDDVSNVETEKKLELKQVPFFSLVRNFFSVKLSCNL